jgi:hypothetical protein
VGRHLHDTPVCMNRKAWWLSATWWLSVRRREVAAVALAAAVIGLIAFTIGRSPFGLANNRGFGPEWDCVSLGKGDPVCVKKPAP